MPRGPVPSPPWAPRVLCRQGMSLVKLTPSLLVSAYAQGIFPMDVDGSIEWFSPDPRAILPLDQLIVTRTLAQVCRRGTFKIRVNTAFLEVMRRCADRDEGTWISPEIIDGYCELHRRGLAHSMEAWKGATLAGGLYGVSLGGAFFGESMFHRVRDASKVALVALVERLRNRGFSLLDVQFMTEHLRRFGAVEIRRRDYLRRLAAAIRRPCRFEDEP